MLYFTNAFSLNMLKDGEIPVVICAKPIHFVDARAILRMNKDWVSAVGHNDTAELYSNLLDMDVPMNRMTLQLEAGDELVVGQYIGTRLPEGTSVLPEGATIKWMLVNICEDVILDENIALKREINHLKAQCQDLFDGKHLAS